jgi:threonyl-tRNA synthetase
MVALTLPDGRVLQFDTPKCGADVAAEIGPGLAKAALAIRVDDDLWDLSRVLDDDAP